MKRLLQLCLTSLVAVALVLGGLLPVAAESAPFDGEKVVVGIIGDDSEEIWQFVADKAKDDGIDVELVLFTDFNTPNTSLADGSLDLNAFQHIAFLEEWNEANDEDLVSLGVTSVNPYRLFSDQHESLEDLPEGGKIAIANDPTNGGRALLALQQAELLTVDPDAGILPTVEDITDNPFDLEIVELDASQLAQTLPDVDGAIINTVFANDANLDLESALFSDGEDVESLPDEYKNVIAARNEDEDNPVLARIVELYQSDDTAEVILEVTNNGSLPAWK